MPGALHLLGGHAIVAAAHPISTLQAALLGVIQGIAELFPISSLGHTVVLPSLFGWDSVVKAQSNPESFWLAFVVALHVGNAVALLAYFWRDWVELIGAWFSSVFRRRIETPTQRLAWLIVIATIPAGILGLLLEHPLRVALAKPEIAAVFLAVNGLVLFAAERWRKMSLAGGSARQGSAVDGRAAVAGVPVTSRIARRLGGRRASGPGAEDAGTDRLDVISYSEAGVLGVAQSTALIAGISREGIVMTAGLGRGMRHEVAARFAFLMATPIILAAGVLKLPDLMGPLGNGVRTQALVGAAVAGVVSVLSIKFLLRFFRSNNLNPFGWYCLLFGAATAIYLAVG